MMTCQTTAAQAVSVGGPAADQLWQLSTSAAP